jgi:hypothetical protein
MGPCGLDRDYVEHCMVVGYSRATGKNFGTDDDPWNELKRLGYSVRECEIVLKQEA